MEPKIQNRDKVKFLNKNGLIIAIAMIGVKFGGWGRILDKESNKIIEMYSAFLFKSDIKNNYHQFFVSSITI